MKYNLETLRNGAFMNIEGLARDLGRVMIIAPHPDDESLGCGGLIAHLRAQQAEVWVLFLTNGEASHPNSKKYPPNKLGRLRKTEAIKACKILDVEEDHLIFLDAGDGQLSTYLESDNSFMNKLHEIFQQTRPDTIFAPWRRDHHTDHVAASELVRRASEGMHIEVVEYPIWLWKKAKREDWPEKEEILPFRLPVGEVMDKKTSAIQAHVSQMTLLIDDDPEGFVFSDKLLQPFLEEYEYFFFQKKAKPAVSAEYFEKLYAESKDPWNFERSTYEQNKYKNTLKAIPKGKLKKALEIGCSNGVFTSMFAPRCEDLLAIDLSKVALESAKERCAEISNCRFLQWDIAQGLPENNFDSIILSEVGYYFKKEKLREIFKEIADKLLPKGILVMVHWTSFVPSYPLTGQQVHEIFSEDHSPSFKLLEAKGYDLYELEVWEKLAK